MVISVRGPETALHLFNPRTYTQAVCGYSLESQERKKNMPLSIPKWLTVEVLFTHTVHYSTFSDRYYCIATGHEYVTLDTRPSLSFFSVQQKAKKEFVHTNVLDNSTTGVNLK